MMMTASDVSTAPSRPPTWLMIATAALAVILLLMAVTETSLVGHYLIDQGEFISVIGLVFIAAAGVVLFRTGRLYVSLPFVLPWLMYPVITQGDQVIDNLSIQWMRLLTHALLVLIFGAPVAVVALGARYAAASAAGARVLMSPLFRWIPGVRLLAEGRHREGVAMLSASLIGLEMYAAHVALGTLMMVALVVMLVAVLMYGSRAERQVSSEQRRASRERQAMVFFVIGLVLSAGLYLGYKNRPGAYQGSPSYLLDPAQQAAGFPIDRVPLGAGPVVAPPAAAADTVREALAINATALDQLVGGYYIVDRNYTWDFHNALFMRSWPLLPNYRQVALGKIAEARQTAAMVPDVAGLLPDGDPLASLLADVQAYVDFNFGRAAIMERMTAEFEKTRAGLQHAAHLYEGEGKLVGIGLDAILAKHAAVLSDPATAAVVAPFLEISRRIHESYANRIVGF